MPRNTLKDLRNSLFKVLEDLVNPEQEISELDIKKAEKITNIARVILETGTAEMKYQRQKADMRMPDDVMFFESTIVPQLKQLNHED